jgi:hypothetical protein
MKKILVVILITLLLLLTFLILQPGVLYAKDDNTEVRLRSVWVLYSDRNTDAELRVEPGFVKESRTIKYIDGKCAAESGCHDISSQDKRYSKCIESCIVYENDWKITKVLTYKKKPFDQDLVIWNIKSR